MRSGPELIRATKSHSDEDPLRTWGALISSTVVAAGATAIAVVGGPFRVLGSLVLGLMIVRFFILFHDTMHRAIFRSSKLGRALMFFYGLVVLSPPRVWRETHNYHHAHTSKLVGSDIGSFPLMTIRMYEGLSRGRKLMYRATRHWLNILFGYVTIFFLGMCVKNTLTQPRKYWDAPLSIVVHFALIAALGWELALYVVVIPMFFGCAIGSYLFYAQHTFPGMELYERRDWQYTTAALRSSSMMRLGPIMNWFTGNIGYHHVHHLNSSIPFYRLPEAQAAVPELQDPITTSLAPKDVLACLRMQLWDPDSKTMVGFKTLHGR